MASEEHPYRKFDFEAEARVAQRKKEIKTEREKNYTKSRRGVEEHFARQELKNELSTIDDLIEEIK